MNELIKQISELLSSYEKDNDVKVTYISFKLDKSMSNREVKMSYRGKK